MTRADARAAPRPQSAGEPGLGAGGGPAAGASRPPLLVQGLAPAAVAGLLLLAALGGAWPLAGAVLLVQMLLVAGVLALLRAPDPGRTLLLALVVSAAALVTVLGAGGRVGGLAGVVALALPAGLVHQLSRRPRVRVVESLAGTVLVVVLAGCAACVVALRARAGGEDAVAAVLVAVAAALLAGRVGDALAPRPPLAPGATRGWPGLLLALAAGAAAAAGLASATAQLPAGRAALLGLAVATAAAVGDLAVDLAALETRGRRTAALRRVALLLPYAAAGPVALVAGALALP